MNRRVIVLAIVLAVTTACGTRNPADVQVIPPDKIMDFSFLYARNCSGCHGSNGTGGAAIGLGDPVYLAIADDAAIRRVTANGVAGTSMPAFAQSSGGMLTDDQIDVIVDGIRTHWAKPDVLRGASAPPYAAQGAGDPKRGAGVYGTYCSSCHGADGRGGKRGSSIVDGSYLALVSDQNLRTTVIVGRRELGAPGWRGDVPGKPMSPEDVSDVVAWIAAQRTEFPGQPYSNSQQTALRTALPADGGIR
ncbi:MAG TPA: cytochrome c [Bryobacteraceae bacterium]|jgi:mono/diheme cytochrome c family protein